MPILVSTNRQVSTLTVSEEKNTIVTVFLVGFIMFFHMVFGVNKNMEALIESRLPREYMMTNFLGVKLTTAARYFAMPPN